MKMEMDKPTLLPEIIKVNGTTISKVHFVCIVKARLERCFRSSESSLLLPHKLSVGRFTIGPTRINPF